MQAQRNQRAHAASGQEARGPRRKLLFVGRGREAKNDDALRLFGMRDVQVIGRSASLLAALRRLEAGAVDVVLLGSEFREEESSLFLLNAQALGFAGLILCVMPTARQLALSSSRSKISSGGSSDGARGENTPGQQSISLAGARRGVPTQTARSSAQTAKFDERYGWTPLTTRQRTVLKRVSDGWTSLQIAQSLKCSEGAIKATLQQLFRKLGVRKRVLLARMASEGAFPALHDGKSSPSASAPVLEK